MRNSSSHVEPLVIKTAAETAGAVSNAIKFPNETEKKNRRKSKWAGLQSANTVA